jgi:hypothetical protein
MNNLATRIILVMRHAEKPAAAGDPNLSPTGLARAQQLATYIPETFGNPDVIIATANSPESARPVQTVTPLAQRCGLQVQTPYADDQFADAARLMLTDAGYKDQPLIVCCWHHEKIPKLMHALGCEKGSYPDAWDETVFNLILKVGIHADGTITVDQIQEPF